MTRLELAEVFDCAHLHGRISRRSCAARHKSFAGKGSTRPMVEGITGCCCRTCPIGAMHAKGKRVADVPLVQVVAKPTQLHRRPRLCLGCGSPLPANTIPRSDRIFGDIQRSVCGQNCASLARDAKRKFQQSQLPEWG
jgi:hypothetical protein